MSSNLDLRGILRRLKPEKRRAPLTRRKLPDLPFLERAPELPRALLYDTTVYVDILQGRFPEAGEFAIRAADGWHSTVTEAELIAPCGFLNPGHPDTTETVRQITAVIEGRPAHRPSRRIGRLGWWLGFSLEFSRVFKAMGGPNAGEC